MSLQEEGFGAEVFGANQWRELTSDLTSHGKPARLVLIGFSYGADDVIRIAEELRTRQTPVDLLITIDPVTPPKVPSNVKRCFNYYQSNGPWDAFPWFRGIPLAAARDGPSILNQNLRTDRRDLLEPDTSHQTIAANRKLHQEIIARVLEICSQNPDALHEPAPPR
jgi:pimeloyl-ACP methyl ester carboxylesterase